MRLFIRRKKLLEDMSQFNETRFGFVLQEENNEFIDETTPFRTLFPKQGKNRLQLTCKKRIDWIFAYYIRIPGV